MQKDLDILVAKDLYTYLWYSIKASILETNNDTLPWFNNRFINVVSYNMPVAPWATMHTWLKLDYIEHIEPENTFKELLEFYSFNMLNII
jgi:hypothetical protein